MKNKKRLVALALAAILASGTTVFGAGSFADFTDYNKDLGYGKLSTHWARNNIETLWSKGGIAGYPEGDFRANKTISAAELLALILSASDNTDNMDENMVWSDRIMDRAYELGICTPVDIPMGNANKAISRELMAVVLVRSAEKILNEDTTTIKLVDKEVISDLNNASVNYRDEIRVAYSMGLLAGDGVGFAPKSSTNRAQAASIICRLFGYMDRVNVKYEAEVVPPVVTPTGTVKPITQQYPALPDGSNVVNGVNYPAEGMTYNGTKTTRDDETGVLGYGNGQQGGIYLGVGKNGRYITAGTVLQAGYDNMGGAYTERGGAVFWDKEWGAITQKVVPELDAKYPNPEIDTVADLYGNLLPKGDSKAAFFFNGNGWALVPK